MAQIMFPVNTVEMSRNSTFTGRDDELNRAHVVLSRQAKDQPISTGSAETKASHRTAGGPVFCVLHGLGGIGKTQIALEYTYRYRSEYDAIFWLAAEHDWTLASTYARIADTLHLLDGNTFEKDSDKRQNLAREKGREWLASTGKMTPCLSCARRADKSRAQLASDL